MCKCCIMRDRASLLALSCTVTYQLSNVHPTTPPTTLMTASITTREKREIITGHHNTHHPSSSSNATIYIAYTTHYIAYGRMANGVSGSWVGRFLRLWRNTHWHECANFNSLLSRAGLGHLGKGWIIRDTTTRRLPYWANGLFYLSWNRLYRFTAYR